MTDSVRRALQVAATLLVLAGIAATTSMARAQSLADLAPPDALLVLEYEQPPSVDGELFADLSALDWAGAGETLRDLVRLAGEDVDDVLDEFPLGILEGITGMDGFGAELSEECPAFPSDVDPLHLIDAGLATMSMSPGSPFPVATFLGRVPSDQDEAAAAVHEALVTCFGSDRAEQDGIAIHILGQGSDLPLAVARLDDVYVAASTPDAVRAVIRRAGGGDEPSLAETRLWQAATRFEGAGVGFALDIAGIARLAEGFIGPVSGGDPAEDYVVRRLLAAGRTLGGVALRAGLTPDGLVFESIVAVDPDGGDPALAQLLLCSDCGVGRPFLVPSGVNGLTSQHIPIRELVAYVESWMDGISEATGEELDLRSMWREEFGIDLDEALLDWVGTQVHAVSLAPFQPTLRQLVYQQPGALLMPVASPEAAERGLELLGEAFGSFFDDILSGAGPLVGSRAMGFGNGLWGDGPLDADPALGFGDGAAPAFDVAVTREQAYRDIPYRRIQVGPTLDVAVGLVGNHLVIATPSVAIRPIIDTFRGDRPPIDDEAYQLARSVAPPGALAIAFEDVGANLAGVAELGHVVAQPIASILAAALLATPVSTEVTPQPGTAVATLYEVGFAELPVRLEGRLSADRTNDIGAYVERYVLTGVPPGQRIRVSLNSDAFDAYLYLLDASGAELARNDDVEMGTDSALTLVGDGGEYLIDVSSFGGGSTGPYTLVVEEGDLADLPQVDLQAVTPRRLGAPGEVRTELMQSDLLPGDAIGTYWSLEGLERGQRVTVSLTSDAFDTYLRVVDPEAGVLLAENDDNPDTTRSAITLGATGDPLWVQVTSWSGTSTGPYALSVEASEPVVAEASDVGGEDPAEPTDAGGERPATPPVEAEREPVDPPGFGDLLALVEIVPDAIGVLAEHVDLSIGYAQVDGSVVYRRSLIQIDW